MLAHISHLKHDLVARGIARTEKYQTLLGPGCVFYFSSDTKEWPLMTGRLDKVSVLTSYQDLALAAAKPVLLEQSTTPYGRGVHFRNVPFTLNSTSVFPSVKREGIQAVMSNVEFVSASNRLAPEISVTLWDEGHRSLCTSLLSGPPSGTEFPLNSDWKKFDAEHRLKTEFSPPSPPLDTVNLQLPLSSHQGRQLSVHEAQGRLRCLVVLRSSQTSNKAGASSMKVIPRAMLGELIQLFATFLAEHLPQYTKKKERPRPKTTNLGLSSYNMPFPTPLRFVASTTENTLTYQASVFSSTSSYEPCEENLFFFDSPILLQAPLPHIYPQQYPIPPWESKIGTPFLPPHTPCLAVEMSLTQKAQLKHRGTYYFVPL